MSEFGFFGDLFDLDGDGNLDDVEQTIDFMAFMEMMEGNKDRDKGSSSFDDDDDDDF